MENKHGDETRGEILLGQIANRSNADLEGIIENLSEKDETAFADAAACYAHLFGRTTRKKFRLAHSLIKIKRAPELTLDKVLRDPKKYSKAAFWDMANEFGGFIDARAAKNKYPRIAKLAYFSSAIAAFGVSALPHELIHAGVNILTSGVNKEIVLNKFFGGSLWASIIPEVQAKWLFPLIGGYVNIEPANRLSHMLTLIAPYCLTPAGIAMFYSGLKRKNAALFTVGAGIVGGHTGGVIGDFWNTGRIMLYQCSDLVSQVVGYDKTPENTELLLALPVAVAGFFIGNRIMSYSYNLMKGTYNSLRNRFSKPKQSV